MVETKTTATQSKPKKTGSKKKQGKKLATAKQLATQEQNDTGIKKTKEFEAFAQWLALPAILRTKTEEELKSYGITDPDVLEMLKIKNLKEFAKKFNLNPGTLSEWKKKAHDMGMFDDAKDLFRSMSKEVYGALFIGIQKNDGDAPRVRVWEEIMHNKQFDKPDVPMPELLGPQFNQVVINLNQSFTEDYQKALRKSYEQVIQDKREELPSTGGVRTDSTTEGGEKEVGGDPGRSDEEAKS